MATEIFFQGKSIKIPGAYSTIKSGISNPAVALAYGNTLFIDTGSAIQWGGGSGINGTIKQGADSFNSFSNVRDFRNFVRGGLPWFLGGPLFLPGGGAAQGISSLTYIKAATTIPATLTLAFGDHSSTPANDGTVVLQLKDEGFVGNGVLGDETRAKATITISNAGTNGNIISIKVGGITIGSYTVQTGNNIAAVVTGLVTAINAAGITEVFSSSSTQIVIYAPRGKGATINSTSPTITVTGTVAGSTSTFTGGVEGTILTRGIAAKVIAGISDTSKYIVQFWRGTFKGLDSSISTGTPFDGIAELDTVAELIAQSPEVDTVTDLLVWMNDTAGKGYTFSQYFKIQSSTIATIDEIEIDDIAGYVKATGGSETYSLSDLSDVLDSITGVYDFILADKWGDSSRSAYNLAIQEWVTNTAKIKPDIYVGSGNGIGEFATSVSDAQAYDAQYVTVVHDGCKLTDVGGRSLKEYDSIVHAAYWLGREAGLPPQVPLTFKNIGVQGLNHALKDREVNQGLDAGLLMARLDAGSFECVKGINTLQNNSFLVNPDGSTHSKQLARVIRQINKELVFNLKAGLLKKPDGANRNTVSPEDVKSYVEAFLNSKVATDTQDNLILTFSAVTVTVSGDAYEITYTFTPSFELSFLIATGILVDPS